MTQFAITAEKRAVCGRKTKTLRADGQVPAVMYGYDIEPTNVTVERNDIEKLYRAAGESSVIELDLAGEKSPVLIQDLQRDPITDFIVHVDFRRINLKEKVETAIRLELVGISPAVKELGGTLIQSLEEVEVEALPTALVPVIEVDVTVLKTFDDVLRVKDLTIPDGIEIGNDPQAAVASVQPPRSEKEMEALDEAVEADVESVEVEGEQKEDEEAAGEETAEATKTEEKKED